MRRYLILGLAVLSLASCRKTEVAKIFEEAPEERAGKRLTELQEILIGEPNGWKGVLSTSLGGGYAFYVKFNNNNTVEMLSDINDQTSSELKNSTFRVKWVMDASLIFDTYNYISLLHDPGAKVPGATSANGLQSDVEFEYIRSSQDSVFLRGKRYKNNFTLIRLNSSQSNAFKTSYTSNINDTKSLISGLKFPYINLPGINNKISFVIDNSSKKISAEYMINEEEINSVTGKFGFDIDGLLFPYAMSIGQTVLTSAKKEEGKVWILDNNGNKYELKSNDVPILSILSTFGYNKANKRILSDPVPGVTANEHIFNKVRELFVASGRSISTMYFQLTNSTTAIFYIGYTASGTNYVASASYSYRMEGNRIFLKRIGIDGGNNWNTRATQVAPVNNLFGAGEEKEFTIEWVASSDPSVVYPIAAIRSVTNPMDMLYGKIGN